MAEIKIGVLGNEPPMRKRKVEGAGSSAFAPIWNLGGLELDWWGDEDVDPALEREYNRQVCESDGFDVDFYIPDGDIMPQLCDKYDYPLNVGLFGKLGLHCYNIQKGTNFQLMGVEKYNTERLSLASYYITLKAMDLADGSSQIFQTCIRKHTCGNNERLNVETDVCRLKGCQDNINWRWNYGVIDDFYRGKMPDWLSDDALATASNKEQYYEVQASDLRENDWLHLYAEFAFYTMFVTYGKGLRKFLPLDIKKVVVQTKEPMEPHMKLKANNAIFYIRFKAESDPSGSPVDYRAIIRKTMDGKLGHIGLQVQCWRDRSS